MDINEARAILHNRNLATEIAVEAAMLHMLSIERTGITVFHLALQPVGAKMPAVGAAFHGEA